MKTDFAIELGGLELVGEYYLETTRQDCTSYYGEREVTESWLETTVRGVGVTTINTATDTLDRHPQKEGWFKLADELAYRELTK